MAGSSPALGLQCPGSPAYNCRKLPVPPLLSQRASGRQLGCTRLNQTVVAGIQGLHSGTGAPLPKELPALREAAKGVTSRDKGPSSSDTEVLHGLS